MSNVEQGLSVVAGAAIGFVLAGPAGAWQGAQYGLLAGSLLFPPNLPDGPRLEDFEHIQSDPGAPVTVVFGTDVVSGFRLYMGPIAEVATEEDVGKGGPEQTTFRYFQTFSVGLCEGVISGVAFIYENGELVYDVRPQREGESTDDFDARIAMSEEYAETFVLYRGTERQMPDPTLELIEGAGNVPGFRGLAYMVWPDRELKPEHGNRHPNLKIGVVSRGELLLTSRPYPLETADEMSISGEPRSGGFPPVLFESIDIGGTVLGGTLQVQSIVYENYEPEAIDIAGVVLSGTLEALILTYENYEPESIDISGTILSGTLDVLLLTYENYEPEAIDITGTILSGTLT